MSVDSSCVPVLINSAVKVSLSVGARLRLLLGIMYGIMEEEVYEFQTAEPPDEPRFCPQAEFNDKPDSLFFNDGVRKIDFIMVYEDEDKKDYEKRHIYQRRKVAFFQTTQITLVSMATQTFFMAHRRNRWIILLQVSDFSVCEGSLMLWRASTRTLATPQILLTPSRIQLLSTTPPLGNNLIYIRAATLERTLVFLGACLPY